MSAEWTPEPGEVVEVSGMRHRPRKIGWRCRIFSHMEEGYAWCFMRKGQEDTRIITAWTYCRPTTTGDDQ